MKHVFVVGGTTFDHIVSLADFPEPIPQTIHTAPFFETTGSTGSGKALSLKKLQVPSMLYSVLGNDSFGKQIIDHLEHEQVDFIYDFDPAGTERHINIMNAEGERISMFITQSSEKPSIDVDKVENALKRTDLIVLNIISYCKNLIPILQKYNKPIWTDLHDYNEGNPYHEPFIEASDYIFLSSDNLSDYRTTMQNLISRGKELVVCTHGKKGVTALTKDGDWIDEPALQGYEIIDANGAGDSFFAGFLYAFMLGKTVKECLRYGAICGAECVTSSQLVSDKISPDYIDHKYSTLYNN